MPKVPTKSRTKPTAKDQDAKEQIEKRVLRKLARDCQLSTRTRFAYWMEPGETDFAVDAVIVKGLEGEDLAPVVRSERGTKTEEPTAADDSSDGYVSDSSVESFDSVELDPPADTVGTKAYHALCKRHEVKVRLAYLVLPLGKHADEVAQALQDSPDPRKTLREQAWHDKGPIGPGYYYTTSLPHADTLAIYSNTVGVFEEMAASEERKKEVKEEALHMFNWERVCTLVVKVPCCTSTEYMHDVTRKRPDAWRASPVVAKHFSQSGLRHPVYSHFWVTPATWFVTQHVAAIQPVAVVYFDTSTLGSDCFAQVLLRDGKTCVPPLHGADDS